MSLYKTIKVSGPKSISFFFVGLVLMPLTQIYGYIMSYFGSSWLLDRELSSVTYHLHEIKNKKMCFSR